METNESQRSLISIDWRWLIVTYCFLVLFGLFPSFLAFGVGTLFRPLGFWWFTLWAGGGVAIISGYIGYRSRGVTILEPGFGSMLYAVTLLAAFEVPWKNAEGYRFIMFRIALLVFAFLIGSGGAAVGEWLQLRKEKKDLGS